MAKEKVKFTVTIDGKKEVVFKTKTLTREFNKDENFGKVAHFVIEEPSKSETKFTIGDYTIQGEKIPPDPVKTPTAALTAKPAQAKVGDLVLLDTSGSKDYEEMALGQASGPMVELNPVEDNFEFIVPQSAANSELKFQLKVWVGDSGEGEFDFADATVTVGTVEPHKCDDPNSHWDDALAKCVCNSGYHDEGGVCVKDVIEPEPTGLLWSSNRDGKWNDGNKRTITKKQDGQAPNDLSIFVAASGSPKLDIDGDGTAHLVSGSGGVDNLSLKLRSRHQAGGDGPNRPGGEGLGVSHSDWDCKRENFHNDHDTVDSGKLPKALKDETWYKIKFSCKDEGVKKIRLVASIDYNDGNGYRKILDAVDAGAPDYFFDMAMFMALSWFWIRLNNADHGRIYTCKTNYNAELELEFKFEPSKNSIALRNVELRAI